jgi:regulator of RNase E activity RraA
MTAGAQARKARGVVIDGRCRDLSEHRAAKFPLFARGHSTLGQSTFTRPAELNVPITIHTIDEKAAEGVAFSPVNINPGDYILADLDGVVCIPVSLAGKVVESCIRAREIDARCLEDIKNGFGVQASFKKWRGK